MNILAYNEPRWSDCPRPNRSDPRNQVVTGCLEKVLPIDRLCI
jgi:hypothetical protein